MSRRISSVRLDVAAKGRDPSGSWLIEQVGSSVAGGRVTEARDYVAAATALGDVLGDPLSSAARRAQWRIDRGYREAQDNRHLEHYHHRPEFETALDELVWGPPETWALHLLGKGGVGKTTLVRYLSSGRFAAERRRPPLPVARIDFDHLDPRYPEQRPAELLMALVGDLSGFTLSRSAYAAMRQVDDASQAVHELLGATSEQSDAESMLAVAIAAFARYLQELRGPVVLVLDTCEELAKLHAPGAVAPAVERTFHILESIHRAVPTVRVLFAGRRWLSQPPPGTAAAASGPMLRARPYLRVLEIGGFTAREAGEYIDRRDPQAGIPAALRAAMLDRCREEDAASAEPRFNPFDLDGYCDWAVAEPDLDPDTLRSAPGDPYIDQRIIGRLGSTTLRDALPVVVEFGRFDLDMVTPALNRRAIEPEVAFNGFANQEWVSTVQYTAEGLPRIIEINEHLRARLHAVMTLEAPVRDGLT